MIILSAVLFTFMRPGHNGLVEPVELPEVALI